MPRHFIPCADFPALMWFQNFIALLQARPEVYPVEAALLARAAAAVKAYEAAYEKAANLRHRTTFDVQAKNEARREAEQLCREIGGILRADRRIGNEALLNAGLNARPPSRRPRAARAKAIAQLPGMRTLMQVMRGLAMYGGAEVGLVAAAV